MNLWLRDLFFQANPFGFAAYFEVKALGQVLRETSENGSDIADGRAVARRFMGRSFPVAGDKVQLTKEGFYASDSCIKAFDKDDDSLQVRTPDPCVSEQVWA